MSLMLSVSLGAQTFKSFTYGLGYFGNTFINPGVEFVVSTPLVDSELSGKSYSALGATSVDLQGSLAMYWDPFSHTGIVNSYGVNLQQHFGRRLGVMIGGGFSIQSNFTTDNYIVNENFELKKRGLKMNSYWGPYISTGVFLDRKKVEHTYLSKVTINLLARYNSLSLPVFTYHFTYFF